KTQGLIWVTNAVVKEGTVIRIEGKIPPDADTFSVNLGSDSENIALHFNPYFQDDSGVIYVNSMSKGSWQAEEIEKAFPFKKGTVTVLKVRVEKDMFVVEGPHNLKVEFPDRLHLPSITTIFIIGKFNLTAYDIH
uniref:Galectin n=1 Tax=Lepisosteus oculatus TaxID=7918 RepID=W5MRY5_LEPOC